ncbi:MAG TPA: hypothetical protein VMW72_15015 [Sedimentisphaerales bacterium]|nr:hypothetical protein [Sedimentisphaerales bacterium]
MIDKRTVFVLGAGASCPYGYPSGAHLRKLICLNDGFIKHYKEYLKSGSSAYSIENVNHFKTAFDKSSIKSIDVFISNNPRLAPVGKYIIAFEVFRAEQRSRFREKAMESKLWYSRKCDDPKRDRDFLLRKDFFQGGDWIFYLYNRLIEGLVGKEALPDFSNDKIVFITFNYDRSLEHFFYESLCNSFAEVCDDRIVQYFKQKNLPVNEQISPQNRELLIQLVMEQLKILHVYGQIAPLKWQSSEGVDYAPQINEELLQKASQNIRTIYEEKRNPELIEAQNLLKQAEEIFFLGFGYAPENMEVLGLPESIPPRCQVYGTAFNMIKEEVNRLYSGLHGGRARDKDIYLTPTSTLINDIDCLMLLKKYLN